MNQELRIMVIKNKVKSIIHDSLFIIHSKGFTLIELLIAIAIIAIMTSFLLANFVGIRQRARDGVRKADLRQIQSALELYRSDKGNYPGTSTLSCRGALTSNGFVSSSDGTTIYMQKIPCDPTNAGQYVYTYSSNGSTYNLYACLENVNDAQRDPSNDSTYCAGGGTNWSYTLQNP